MVIENSLLSCQNILWCVCFAWNSMHIWVFCILSSSALANATTIKLALIMLYSYHHSSARMMHRAKTSVATHTKRENATWKLQSVVLSEAARTSVWFASIPFRQRAPHEVDSLLQTIVRSVSSRLLRLRGGKFKRAPLQKPISKMFLWLRLSTHPFAILLCERFGAERE